MCLSYFKISYTILSIMGGGYMFIKFNSNEGKKVLILEDITICYQFGVEIKWTRQSIMICYGIVNTNNNVNCWKNNLV